MISGGRRVKTNNEYSGRTKRLTLEILSVCLLLGGSAALIAGPGKLGKGRFFRFSEAFTDSTQGIIIRVGNGSGEGEAVLQETLTYIPHREDLYSVYNGFFGLTFESFAGEVTQTRYIERGWPLDGELLSLDSMAVDSSDTTGGFTVARGIISDTLRADAFDVAQKCLLRPEHNDNFAILEYTVRNLNNPTYIAGILVAGVMRHCRALFFCDFDVGDSYNDNLTGRVDSLNLVYQYSPDDDYAGVALIYPDSSEIDYGNFNNWYNNGRDARIDTLTAMAFRPDTFIYDTLWESRQGDHSSFLVVKPDSVLAPGDSITLTFALAIDTTLENLTAQIAQAAEAYQAYRLGEKFLADDANSFPQEAGLELFTARPNPFNSRTEVEFSLNDGGEVDVAVYNLLGRRVATLFRGFTDAGKRAAQWRGVDERGMRVSAGIYFIRAEYPGGAAVKKIAFVP